MSFAWLKRWMPRGLYGRAALILVLPVVLLQLAVSISFVQRYFDGVTRQLSGEVVSELRYLFAEMDAPGASAAQVIAEVAAPLGFDITRPAPPPPGADQRDWIDLTGLVVIEVFRGGLPDVLAIDLSDPRWVSLTLDRPGGPLQIGFSRKRVTPPNPHQLIVLVVVFGALLVLIAFSFLRNQLRPITRMAAAAQAYGKGRVLPYRPGGALEVRQAGQAFVDMRDKLERANAQRVAMLSGISHDLRTPLTRLRLDLSLLPEEQAAPMVGDVQDMGRMLDAFLDFARGDALGELEASDPAALAAQAMEDAARAGQQVRLVATLAEAVLLPLRPMAIRRALDNLIGNALQHGSRAELSLLAGPSSLSFIVEDDGPGIEAQRRDEAMRPFTRLDPARNLDRGAGVGLGLAIVSDIALSHGGQLVLGASDRLGGLRAEIRLPR